MHGHYCLLNVPMLQGYPWPDYPLKCHSGVESYRDDKFVSLFRQIYTVFICYYFFKICLKCGRKISICCIEVFSLTIYLYHIVSFFKIIFCSQFLPLSSVISSVRSGTLHSRVWMVHVVAVLHRASGDDWESR